MNINELSEIANQCRLFKFVCTYKRDGTQDKEFEYSVSINKSEDIFSKKVAIRLIDKLALDKQ